MAIVTKKFTYKGRTLETRAATLRMGWAVWLYESDRQVCPVRFDVSSSAEPDDEAQKIPSELVADLMDLMQYEVENGRLRLLPPKSN